MSNRDYSQPTIGINLPYEFEMTESKFDSSLPDHTFTNDSKIHKETIDENFDAFIDSLWDPALEFFKYGDPIDPCGNLVCAAIAFNLFFLYSKYCRQKFPSVAGDPFAFTREDRVFITLSFIFHKKQTNKYIDKYKFIYQKETDENKNACALGCATRVNKIVENPLTYHPQFIPLLCCDKELEDGVCPPYNKDAWGKGRKPNLLFRYFFSIYQVFRKFATEKNEYEKGTITYISPPLQRDKKHYLKNLKNLKRRQATEKARLARQEAERIRELEYFKMDVSDEIFNWFCRRCLEKDFYDENKRGGKKMGCSEVCDGKGNVNPQFDRAPYKLSLKEFQKQNLKEPPMSIFPTRENMDIHWNSGGQ